MGWTNLNGTMGYSAGASGTATIPKGASVLQIVAHSTAGGTLTIFGGASIPIVANTPFSAAYRHRNWAAADNTVNAGTQDLVFSGTDSFYVEWVKSGNT